MLRDIFSGMSTLIGMTVGAGILGLPYVINKAGFIPGIILMIVLGTISIIVNLCIAEVVLRTKGKHQLIGLAEKYLGKKGKLIFGVFSILALYGTLVAYILGAGDSLKAIFGGSSFFFSLLFWFIFSCVIFGSIKILEDVEDIFSSLKMLLLFIISIIAIFHFKRLELSFDLKNILYPYGVILFAFSGIWAVPEMALEMKNKKNLKKAIIYAGFIVLLFSILFVFSLLSSLAEIKEVGTTGLGLLGNIFALFAFATAFVAIGYSLKDSYSLDYKLNKNLSWLFVIIVPLIIVLLQFSSFIKVLEFTGGILGGLILILSILLFLKAKKLGNRKPEFDLKLGYFSYLIIILLIIGVFVSLYYSF
ncbi:MAG TPA: aromatic amino acid transport family protein [Candidatus Nanoarchaeia archaeon]|nr:aromatic amino acid transport family protein [Candidatus Nanoarchaeia archaeon]